MSPDCLFCKISNKTIPAKIIDESDQFVAFKDINPQAPIHILIVPKKHIHSIAALEEVDKPLVSELIFTAKRIANELELVEMGYRLVFNSGPDAGQSVDHLHLHLIGGSRLGPIA